MPSSINALPESMLTKFSFVMYGASSRQWVNPPLDTPMIYEWISWVDFSGFILGMGTSHFGRADTQNDPWFLKICFWDIPLLFSLLHLDEPIEILHCYKTNLIMAKSGHYKWCNWINSLAPGRCGSNFKPVISNISYLLVSWAFSFEIALNECSRTSSMITQHWFR